MSFLRRKKPESAVVGEVLWGIAGQPGYSDTDDPAPNRNTTQHAFELGHDEEAICGFVPPRRRSSTGAAMHPLLATAGPFNPICRKCRAILESAAASPPQPPLARLEDQS
jgi:hypothetical protein